MINEKSDNNDMSFVDFSDLVLSLERLSYAIERCILKGTTGIVVDFSEVVPEMKKLSSAIEEYNLNHKKDLNGNDINPAVATYSRKEIDITGEYIRRERKKMNISIGKFAEMMDISRSYLSRIERGETSIKTVNPYILGRIAQFIEDYNNATFSKE